MGVDTVASKILFTNYSGKLSFSQLSLVTLPPVPKLSPGSLRIELSLARPLTTQITTPSHPNTATTWRTSGLFQYIKIQLSSKT